MTDLSKTDAREEIGRLKKGMPSVWRGLYVWPNPETQRNCEEFSDRLKGRKYGILPVRGQTGAGKTRLVTMLKEDLREHKMAISHIVLRDAEDMRRVGITTFLPQTLIKVFAFMEEGQELNVLRALEEEDYRRKFRKVFDNDQLYNGLFYHGSRHLTVVFDCLTSDDPGLRKGARDWLNGYQPSTDDEAGKDRLKAMRAKGLETTAKSVKVVTTDETLFFLRDLAEALGYSPYLTIVDEIEKAAELPPKMGKTFLSGIRDLINLLYATEHDIPEQEGLFVVVSISDQYLTYGGIAEDVPTIEVAGRERFGKPRTDLRDVPRLWTVLNGIRSWADVNIKDKKTMVRIGERVRDLYVMASGDGAVEKVDLAKLVDQ